MGRRELTPYGDVNVLIDMIHKGAKRVLGAGMVAMYVDGSLALGGFEPKISDIDFIVVTERQVNDEEFAALATMHVEIGKSGSPLASEIEGSYIPRASMRRYDEANSMHPRVERPNEPLAIKKHDTDWVIHYYIAREYGIVVEGPEPKSLIDVIGPEELRAATWGVMWWFAGEMREPKNVLQNGYQWYTIQTMARVLYTMETGAVTSKRMAANWAVERVPAEQARVIAKARDWDGVSELDELAGTQALIEYVVARGQAGPVNPLNQLKV